MAGLGRSLLVVPGGYLQAVSSQKHWKSLQVRALVLVGNCGKPRPVEEEMITCKDSSRRKYFFSWLIPLLPELGKQGQGHFCEFQASQHYIVRP